MCSYCGIAENAIAPWLVNESAGAQDNDDDATKTHVSADDKGALDITSSFAGSKGASCY